MYSRPYKFTELIHWLGLKYKYKTTENFGLCMYRMSANALHHTSRR